MPHEQDRLSSESDQLSRKIERLIAGQPAPILDNPDTEDLAELAAMLQRYLAKDLPDPDFRAQLKADLINPHPRLVNFPRRSRPRRYPISAFAGALAFAMIAAMATGWMVFGPDNGSLNLAASQSASLASTATATPRPAAFAMIPTATAHGAIATSNSDDSAEVETAPSGAVGVLAEETPDVNAQDSAEFAADDPEEPTQSAPAITPTPTSRSGMTQVSSATAPSMDLPPIDRAHVELGALATATGAPAQNIAGVTYTLDQDLPELEGAASAYRFSTPHVQPDLIVDRVAEFLGLDEADVETLENRGRTVYSLVSPDSGAKFTFTPTTGAFSCTVPESFEVADIEDLDAWAIDWLQRFGYPVDDDARTILQTLDSGERQIHVPIDDEALPESVVGHPMTISLVLDPTGRVIKVSGYWLEKIQQSELTLLTTEQAWDAISHGGGYWPDGNAPTKPGEFRVNALGLTYMLTVDDDNQLVLQPVISASGVFHPTDGSEAAPSTVYLQAAAQA